MTIKELKEIIQDLPDNDPVLIVCTDTDVIWNPYVNAEAVYQEVLHLNENGYDEYEEVCYGQNKNKNFVKINALVIS